MKHFKRILLFLLCVLSITSVFTIFVVADDNANTGGGSSGNASKGQGYYSNGQYLWKVSLYVGKTDRTSKSDNLNNDFYLVGNTSIYIRPTTCTAWSSARYGLYNKVQYLNGYRLQYNQSPVIIVDSNCPIPPVAYSAGNLDTVKLYFGSTQTLEAILNTIAAAKGTTVYGLVSDLTFNIGGVSKSGWSAEWLLPSSAMTNRVPWVIIYEPVIIAFLKDGVTKLAFTATEYALAQIYGWYNFCNRADGPDPQYLQTLTRCLAPSSVKLQESWFGYGVYESGYNEIWTDEKVVYFGGWGMRWLSNIQEPIVIKPEYGVSIREIGENVQPNSTLTLVVFWKSYQTVYDIVLCEILVDGTVVASEYIDLKDSVEIGKYDIFIVGTSTKTITARINWAFRHDETNPNNNIDSVQVTPIYLGDSTYDFSISDLSVTPNPCYQGEYVTVYFRTDNWNRDISYSKIPIEVLVNGIVVKTDYQDFTPYGTNYCNYNILMSSHGSNTISARINWDKRNLENNPNNNSVSTTVTVKKNYEFSVSDLTLSPSSVREKENITVTFRTDCWDEYNSYYNIPVDLLYNGTILQTLYVDYSPYAGYIHTFTVNVGATAGTNTITARVNWSDRSNETNPNNNSVSNQIIVLTDTDLSISPILPNSTYNEGTEVITSFFVYNNGSHDIIPSNNITVTFEAFYYENGIDITVYKTTKNHIVIPAYGSNLVYFKWKVPEGMAGKTFHIVAYIDFENIIDETDEANNHTYFTTTITKPSYMDTPETKFEKEKPTYWRNKSAPAAYFNSNFWSEWEYENGSFVKKSYGVMLSANVLLTPDVNAFSSWRENGQWYMRSGYAFSINCTGYPMIAGVLFPDSNAYTVAQNAFVFFPEFDYETGVNKYRSLQYVNGVLQFFENDESIDNYRVHFTPLWYPDGEYVVYCQIYDFWTPAGMLSAGGIGKLNIRGSCYDDWYLRHIY